MPWIKREPIEAGSRPKRQGRDLAAKDPLSLDEKNELLEKEAWDRTPYGQKTGPAETENMVTHQKAVPRGHLLIAYRTLFFIFAGSFLVVIWAFILGIVVGRDTISQTPTLKPLEDILVSELKQNAPPEVKVGEGTEKTGGDSAEANPNLTFYKALNQPQPNPERGLPAMTLPQSPSLPKIKDNIEEARQKSATTQAKETEKKKLAPARGVKTVDPDSSKAPAPARQPDDNFTVQVAAAATVQEAEKEVNQLKKGGFDAYYYEVELNGRKYFRVRVGRYKTREQAQVILDKLASSGRRNIFISILTD